MTGQDRITRAESILRRQNSGKITKEQASAEFDRLLDSETGDLHYFSDTTCMKGEWDNDVMAFPHRDDITKPSNTGIITQGARRGEIVTKFGETCNAHREVLKHFRGTSS